MAGLGLSVLSQGTVRLERCIAELDVKGFPLLRHWHVAWPRGKRLSVGARAFFAILLGAPTARDAEQDRPA